MRKSILFATIFISHLTFSQNYYPPNGAVGIGTLTPNSTLALDVNGKAFVRSLFYVNDIMGGDGGDIRICPNTSGPSSTIFLVGGITQTEGMRLSYNGNVGIGTNTPQSKLSVSGSVAINSGLINNENRPAVSAGTLMNGELRAHSRHGNIYDDGFLRLSAGGGTNSIVKSYIDLTGYSTIPDMNQNIVFGTHGTERMRINTNGYIGIGTTAPDEKLTVNGKIHTKEVRVDLDFPAPDYVFANDYQLKPLHEVEDYIKQNSHLPEIPSAKEIENNGLMLAEMNMALLKKIEELTLYAIEQEKNTAKLIHLLEEQNKRLKLLEESKN